MVDLEVSTVNRAMPSRPSKSKSPAPQNEQPSAQQPAPGFDEGMHNLWQKYGQAALVAAGLVLLFYVVRVGWDFVRQHHEGSVQSQFAQAMTPADLKAFVAAHPDRELAGVADLELADRDYASGDVVAAVSEYADAARILKGKPLEERAEIGLGVSQLQAGQTSDGEATLRRILDDPAQLPVLRAEAGSELASVAAAQGNRAEVQQLAMRLMQIDQNSPWTQRAFALTVK